MLNNVLYVLKRNKTKVIFNENKIRKSIFYCIKNIKVKTNEKELKKLTEKLMNEVIDKVNNKNKDIIDIETIQDLVEETLMDNKLYKEAKAYILYRMEHENNRDKIKNIKVKTKDNKLEDLNSREICKIIYRACKGLNVNINNIFTELQSMLYNEIEKDKIIDTIKLSIRNLIIKDPEYDKVLANIESFFIKKEVFERFGLDVNKDNIKDYFFLYIDYCIKNNILNKDILNKYNLDKLANSLKPEIDFNFDYLGIKTFSERYLLRNKDLELIEIPSVMFMRVAMGIYLEDEKRNDEVIKLYNIYKDKLFMSSTPTLFNSCTNRSQLSSCYLTTIDDSIEGIFDAYKEDAFLSKYAGGVANDWHQIRGLGSYIKGTNGLSQGLIPFLKLVNDLAVAVNQGGKRRGSVCCYIEPSHIDIYDFLDLKKNTGEERRRAHDINTALWIPDIFMERVKEKGKWLLFSPDEDSELHDLYGENYTKRYLELEEKARRGELKVYKFVEAEMLMRRILTSLYETGHPWLCWKDPSNIRYTNKHVGVVHSSNLCTEIIEHTNEKETAVCNLGSLVISNFIKDNVDKTKINSFNPEIEKILDLDKLKNVIKTVVRALDNVIDVNFYPSKKAQYSNLRNRPIGLGLMGWNDLLFKLKIPFSSMLNVRLSDRIMEYISYYAIEASVELGKEKGNYKTFKGSLWNKGILPIDSLKELKNIRKDNKKIDVTTTLDWNRIRNKVKNNMRNSLLMAIAPTASISNIVNCSPTIEPIYQNVFVKSNLNGEFIKFNMFLVNDLKEKNLWDKRTINDLIKYEGSIQNLNYIDNYTKELYKTSFEIDNKWIIRTAAARMKWIDQSQSTNLFVYKPTGKELMDLYINAYDSGLKTTYYLKVLTSNKMEKTIDDFTTNEIDNIDLTNEKFCSIDDDECLACQ